MVNTTLESTTASASNTTGYNDTRFHPAPDVDEVEPAARDHQMIVGYSLISSVGIVGNCLVIAVIASNKKMLKKIPNLYLINQSLADLMGAVMLFITGLCYYILNIKAEDLKGWAALVYCRVIPAESVLFAFFTVSTYNLMALTIERYFEIVKPIWYKLHVNRAVAIGTMAGVWVFGSAFILLESILSTDMIDGTCVLFSVFPNVFWAQFTAWVNAILLLICPLTTMAYCYLRIVISLKSRVGIDNEKSEDNPRARLMARTRRSVLKTLATVSVFFALSWSYATIPYFLSRIEVLPYTFWSTLWGRLVGIITASNCCINPFIYALQYTEFKKAARAFFCRRFRNTIEVDESTLACTVSKVVT